MKYCIGHIMNGGKSSNSRHAVERRISFDGNDIFAIVSKTITDKECEEHWSGAEVIWKVEKSLKDRRGDPYILCVPVRIEPALQFVTNEQRFYGNRMVNALNGSEVWMNKESRQIIRRLAFHNGIPVTESVETVQDAIFEKLINKELDVKTAIDQSNTPIPSFPETAHLFPEKIAVGRVSGIFMHDANNADAEFFINATNVDVWRRALPPYLTINKLREDIIASVDLEQCSLIRCASDALERLQNTGDFKVDVFFRTDPFFEVIVRKENPEIQKYLCKAGLDLCGNYFVPKDMPDFEIVGLRSDEPLEVLPQEPVKVRFSNGMTASYPAVFIAKKYPTHPDNFRFSSIGQSLSTVRIRIEKIR